MICQPCVDGKHCGEPGEVTQSCFCQHWPRKKLVGLVKVQVVKPPAFNNIAAEILNGGNVF